MGKLIDYRYFLVFFQGTVGRQQCSGSHVFRTEGHYVAFKDISEYLDAVALKFLNQQKTLDQPEFTSSKDKHNLGVVQLVELSYQDYLEFSGQS